MNRLRCPPSPPNGRAYAIVSRRVVKVRCACLRVVHSLSAAAGDCRAYDPAFTYEVATIIDSGTREMVEQQRDAFCYVTVTNKNYAQPSMPDDDAAARRDGIPKGMYRLPSGSHATARVQLLGAGAILGEVLATQRMPKDDWGIDAALWSGTSFSELQRDGIAAERLSRLGATTDKPYVTRMLDATQGPVIAATDYVHAVSELIRAYVSRRYVMLGTDGFGHSDTREALRTFFEVDRASIVLAALKALADEGEINAAIVRTVRERLRKIMQQPGAPWQH